MYLEPRDHPRFEKRITLAYYLSFICQGLISSIFGPAMVYFAGRTNSAISGITPLLVFYNLGFIISSLFISRLFDRRPGNRLIGISICTASAAVLGLCAVRSRWQLFLLAGIIGAALSVIDNGPNVMFTWLLGSRAKRPMNLVHLFYSVGCIITPFLISLSLRHMNSIAPVLILVSAAVIFPALTLFRLPSPRAQADSNAAASGNPDMTGRDQILAAAGLFGLLMFLFASCQSTINSWISTVLIRSSLAGESEAAMMTSVFWIGTFSGRLLAAWLVGRVPPARIVFGCLLISAANGTMMLLAPKTLLLIGAGVFIYGFSTGPIIANALGIMKERGLVSAKINGIVLACGQFGGMLMPSLFGRIWGDSPANFVPFILITLIASLANLAVLRLIMRKG